MDDKESENTTGTDMIPLAQAASDISRETIVSLDSARYLLRVAYGECIQFVPAEINLIKRLISDAAERNRSPADLVWAAIGKPRLDREARGIT